SWTETGTLEDRVLADVMRAASNALKVAPDDLEADVDLHEYGFYTLSLAHMTRQLSGAYGLDDDGLHRGSRLLPPSDLLDYWGSRAPTLRGFAAFMLNEYGDVLRQGFASGGATGTDGTMDALLARLLLGQLRAAGLIGREATAVPARGLPGVYDRWLQASIAMLGAYGLLQYTPGARAVGARPAASAQPTDIDALWHEWDRHKHAWLIHPDYQARVTLVEATLRALPDILAGKQRATDILFPNGSMQLVEPIYQHNTVADYFNEVLADTVVAYIQELRAE